MTKGFARLLLTTCCGALVTGSVAVGCSSGDGPGTAQQKVAETPITDPTTGALKPRVSPTFELASVVDRARHAFRSEGGDRFVAGVDVYKIEVNNAGAIQYRPFHWAAGKTAADKPLEGGVASFQTADMSRTRTGLVPLTEGTSSVDGEGALVINRGVLDERLQGGRDGVEQSWLFSAPPEGAGDLIVHVNVSGYAYVGADAGGLHFKDAASGLGVLYSTPYWVGADGERSELPLELVGSQIEIRVNESLLEGSAYPAVLDPTITGELVVSSPVLAPTYSDDDRPGVAFDGTNFLVAWADRRNVTAQIYGARMTTAGTVLDGQGFAISAGTGDRTVPTVAFNGTNYLVTWQDARNGDSDVFGARVTPSGTVLDTTGIQIATGANVQQNAQIVRNGTDWVVVWEDSTAQQAQLKRVSAAGAPDATAVVVSAAAVGRLPAAYCSGASCLVAWANGVAPGDVYAALYDPASGTAGTPFVVNNKGNDQTRPAVSADGTNFVVLWSDRRSGTYDIYGSRVSTAGAVLDGANGIAVATGAGNQSQVDVAWDGTNFLASWQDDASAANVFDLKGARLTSALASAGALTIASQANSQRFPKLAVGGSGWAVAFQDNRTFATNPGNIYVTRVSSAGAVLDANGIVVSTSGNRQTLTAVAGNGSAYLVAWSDNRGVDGSYDLWGALVSSTGSLLANKVISAAAGDQITPDVIYDSAHSQFYVAWQDRRGNVDYDIYGARVTASASTFTVVDASGVSISNATGDQKRVAVAASSSGYLATWQDQRVSNNSDIYAQRIGFNGALTGSEIQLSSAGTNETLPMVASDGTNYFVLWQDARGGANTDDIYACGVSSTGSAGTEVAVSTAANQQMQPQIVFNSSQYFALWTDFRNNATSSDIYGSAISTAGVVSPAVAIANTADAESRPGLAVSNGSIVAVWLRAPTNTQADVYGARLTNAGAITEGPFSVSVTTTAEDTPRLGANGSRVLVAYSRFVASATENSERVRYRVMTFSGAGGGTTCTAANQCASGFCTDGYCCDQACTGGCGVCSVAKGAAVNGTCSVTTAGTTCRAAVGTCDAAETCNGVSAACPSNAVQPNTFLCRPKPTGSTCQNDGYCNGASTSCPTSPPLPAGTLCRVSPYPCATDQVCNGTTLACPSGFITVPAGQVCRPPIAACDVAEQCDGSDWHCPDNVTNCP